MAIKIYDFRGEKGGLIKDSSSFTLVDNEWSEMMNVRIRNRGISRILGETSLLALTNVPSHSKFISGSANQFYAYIDTAGKTYAVAADGTETDITRQDAGVDAPLTAGVKYQINTLAGGYIVVVNDGVKAPEYITTVGAGSDTENLAILDGWNYDTDYTDVSAAVIRPFNNVLVAGDIKQTRVSDSVQEHNGGTIRVSNAAMAGSLPTWDPSPTDSIIAQNVLVSDNGSIRDMVSLGDTLMIFTEDDIYAMELTGSTVYPVDISKELNGRGILSADCAVEVFGKLYVVGPSDIYTFQGGANAESIVEGRVRDYFFGNLSKEFAQRTFIRHNQRYNEIWIHYPSINSVAGECDMALIYSYSLDSWTERQLPNVAIGSYGPSITSGEFNLDDLKLTLPSQSDMDLKRMDEGDTFSGEEIDAEVIRENISLNPSAHGISYVVSDITFIMSGSGTSDIRLQSTDKLNEVIDFDNDTDIGVQGAPFDLSEGSQDLSIHPRINGKFLNLRVKGSNPWSLHDYVVLYEQSDERSR